MMVVREQEASRRPCAHGPLDKRSKGGAGRRRVSPKLRAQKDLEKFPDFSLGILDSPGVFGQTRCTEEM